MCVSVCVCISNLTMHPLNINSYDFRLKQYSFGKARLREGPLFLQWGCQGGFPPWKGRLPGEAEEEFQPSGVLQIFNYRPVRAWKADGAAAPPGGLHVFPRVV